MPSVLVDAAVSGGMRLISGNAFSGRGPMPFAGVQLSLGREASGAVYFGLSGNLTRASGGFPLSGGGRMDGMPINPGGSYFIPRAGINTDQSGSVNIFVTCDPAASGGFARLYYEVY